MKLKNFIPTNLFEVSTQSYDYSCAMLYFSFPELAAIQNKIAKRDIYTEDNGNSFGLEDESHCTLLYGLHSNVTVNNVKSVIDKFKFSNYILSNPSLFKNEKYDVLKFDVSGDNLYEINKELRKYPYTSDFPEYHPHCTIAYLNPDKGQGYVDIIKKKKNKFTVIPSYCVFSEPSGKKTKIQIK